MQRRELRNLRTGTRLGFEAHGRRFYTCPPRVYLISQPSFNTSKVQEFLEDMDLGLPSSDQLCGEPGDNLFESGARDCYLSYGRGRAHADCIENLRNSKHGSVFEHGMVVLKCGAVSRGLTHELTRHRVGISISQVSSRYVEPDALGFIVPILARGDELLENEFVQNCLDCMASYRRQYAHVIARLCSEQEKRYATVGIRKAARGLCRESLPIGINQVFQYGMNLRIARHIMTMRGSKHAEALIREWAREVARAVYPVWPQGLFDLTDNGAMLNLSDGNF